MLSIEVQNRILQLNPWLRDPGAAVQIDRFLPSAYVVRGAEEITLEPDRAMLEKKMRLGVTTVSFVTPLGFIDWLSALSP